MGLSAVTEYLLLALGVAIFLIGCLGCVVPVLPGPILAYAALWILPSHVGAARLWIAGGVVALSMVVDYVLPALISKKFKCSRLCATGCLIGAVIGIFFLPFGIIIGPVLGAVAGELLSGSGLKGAFRGGLSALAGFVVCTAFKLAAVALCAYWFMSVVTSKFE